MAISNDGMESREAYGMGAQFMDSLKGILTGLALFPISFIIIWQVETCTQAGDAFKNAKPVSQAEEGKPVYITGTLAASPVGNYFIKQGNYISVRQSSEILAWDEEEKTEGSGANKEKVRTCKLKWTTSPDNPSSFKLPACKSKQFFQRTVKDETVVADNAKITQDGKSYSVDLKDVKLASAISSSSPPEDQITSNGWTLSGNYLYNDPRCSSQELQGCERISLSVTPVPSKSMTFLGSLSGSSLTKYVYKDDKFLNASIGTYEETMKDIKGDDSTTKWIGRIIGFIAMWASFALLAGPLTTVLDFIPIIGSMGKSAINFVLGFVAFIITLLTILLIKLWFVWLLILAGAIGYGFYKRKQQKAAATT